MSIFTIGLIAWLILILVAVFLGVLYIFFGYEWMSDLALNIICICLAIFIGFAIIGIIYGLITKQFSNA